MGAVLQKLVAAVQPLLFWSSRRYHALLPPQPGAPAADLAREEASFSRAVIDHMVLGLVVVDGLARIESANPAAEAVFRYASDELVGRRVSAILPAFASQTPEQVLSANGILEVGGVIEFEAMRKTGELFPIEMAMYSFPTSAGRRFAISARDVTERRSLDRLKRDFVAMVSHELRTPLTSIHGSLRLLSEGALGHVAGDAGEAVRIAERNATRLLALINDILDCERLASGEALPLKPVPMASAIVRSIESVQVLATQAGITIEVQSDAGTVLGDSDRLVQILVNLLGNAIKFSPAGSIVTVASAEQIDWVEVTVTDRGRGIPADQIERVFERFHQIDAAKSRALGGTGLGLAICRTLVDKHGGDIGVESVEGHGSTFWFRIPSVTRVAAQRDNEPLVVVATTAP